MLNSFRRATENIFLRIFIFAAVIAFAVWGFGDLFRNRDGANLATFEYLPAITTNELIGAIRDQKRHVQTNYNLSDAQFAKLIFQQIVRQRLVEYLVNDLEIDFDQQKLIELIKAMPELKGDDGRFDQNKFHGVLKNLGITEENYLHRFNSSLSASVFYSGLEDGIYQNPVLLDKIQAFLSEERVVKILSVNKQKLLSEMPKPEEGKLKDFFEENVESFRVPQTRDFKYIVLNQDFFIKQKLLNDRKDTVKLKNLLVDHEKLLEDEVAAGKSLEEIAQGLNIKIQTAERVDLEKALKLSDINLAATQIFELHEGELSYPLYFDDQKILLVLVDKVNQSYLPDLKDVVRVVQSRFLNNAVDERIKVMLEEARGQNAAFDNLAKQKSVQIDSGVRMFKNVGSVDSKVPRQLRDYIFKTSRGGVTPVYIDNNSGYIAYIEDVRVDKNSKKQVPLSNIKALINDGYAEEILQYASKVNKVKLKQNDPMFRE